MILLGSSVLPAGIEREVLIAANQLLANERPATLAARQNWSLTTGRSA